MCQFKLWLLSIICSKTKNNMACDNATTDSCMHSASHYFSFKVNPEYGQYHFYSLTQKVSNQLFVFFKINITFVHRHIKSSSVIAL